MDVTHLDFSRKTSIQSFPGREHKSHLVPQGQRKARQEDGLEIEQRTLTTEFMQNTELDEVRNRFGTGLILAQ